MATKKNAKATTKSKVSKKSGKKVTAKASSAPEVSVKTEPKKSTQASAAVAKSRTSTRAKTATKKSAAKPKKASSLVIEFKLQAPDANTVCLAGDFNGWLVDKDKLAKGKDGVWRKRVTLSHGKYEYQFVVDGNWWTDPENPNRAWNSFGTENSVKEI
ncbi:MAG: isoamylase early set domain-containing protein [Deltaproteobacteria bacterium]|nr:isoamylase early set domain-containing protein [Deltaproteobacteria bacterium]